MTNIHFFAEVKASVSNITLLFCFQALPQNLLHHSDRHPRESASQTTEHAEQPGETLIGPSSSAITPAHFLFHVAGRRRSS